VRILLDECVNPRVRAAFPGHEVTTVTRSIEHQQNVAALDFGVVIVHVARNRLSHYEPLFERMRKAVETVQAGEVTHASFEFP
jgi:hypothetical protein